MGCSEVATSLFTSFTVNCSRDITNITIVGEFQKRVVDDLKDASPYDQPFKQRRFRAKWQKP